ncbi:MAG: hypothetical protein Q9220_007330 [cf. Caloplaca sp. 1 TL-2023]
MKSISLQTRLLIAATLALSVNALPKFDGPLCSPARGYQPCSPTNCANSLAPGVDCAAIDRASSSFTARNLKGILKSRSPAGGALCSPATGYEPCSATNCANKLWVDCAAIDAATANSGASDFNFDNIRKILEGRSLAGRALCSPATGYEPCSATNCANKLWVDCAAIDAATADFNPSDLGKILESRSLSGRALCSPAQGYEPCSATNCANKLGPGVDCGAIDAATAQYSADDFHIPDLKNILKPRALCTAATGYEPCSATNCANKLAPGVDCAALDRARGGFRGSGTPRLRFSGPLCSPARGYEPCSATNCANKLAPGVDCAALDRFMGGVFGDSGASNDTDTDTGTDTGSGATLDTGSSGGNSTAGNSTTPTGTGTEEGTGTSGADPSTSSGAGGATTGTGGTGGKKSLSQSVNTSNSNGLSTNTNASGGGQANSMASNGQDTQVSQSGKHKRNALA